MNILDGKNLINIDSLQLENIVAGFDKICVDIGTGDGRNIYRKAKAEPGTFFIGIDPVKDNMEEIAVKLNKKPEKGGLKNVVLAVAAAENMPPELHRIADTVTVLFPWGILLEGVVKPIDEFIDAVAETAKSGGKFEFITTYSPTYEENTIETRAMPELSIDYFNGEYTDILKKHGLIVESVEMLDNEFVKGFDSKWARRLAFGRKRDFYRITGSVL